MTDQLDLLDARMESLEGVIEMLVEGMQKQNAAIGDMQARLNSLELSRKKQDEIGNKIVIAH